MLGGNRDIPIWAIPLNKTPVLNTAATAHTSAGASCPALERALSLTLPFAAQNRFLLPSNLLRLLRLRPSNPPALRSPLTGPFPGFPPRHRSAVSVTPVHPKEEPPGGLLLPLQGGSAGGEEGLLQGVAR